MDTNNLADFKSKYNQFVSYDNQRKIFVSYKTLDAKIISLLEGDGHDFEILKDVVTQISNMFFNLQNNQLLLSIPQISNIVLVILLLLSYRKSYKLRYPCRHNL